MTQIEWSLDTDANATPIASELGAERLYEKCMALARNLWWSWHPEVTNLFRDIDPSVGDSSTIIRSHCFASSHRND